jgi:hypothetical protein
MDEPLAPTGKDGTEEEEDLPVPAATLEPERLQAATSAPETSDDAEPAEADDSAAIVLSRQPDDPGLDPETGERRKAGWRGRRNGG